MISLISLICDCYNIHAYLPRGGASGMQPVEKLERGGTKVADAVITGEGRGMQQDTATPWRAL